MISKELLEKIEYELTCLTGLYASDNDDSYALEKLLPVLQKNFEILADLVEKYGVRNNTIEIKKLLKDSMIICVSGYDTEANIVYLRENEYRSLIMPKITSRFINKQMKEFDLELEKLSEGITLLEEDEKFEKRDMPRIWNGMLCQNNRPIAISNEMDFRSAVYNTIHLGEMKGTFC